MTQTSRQAFRLRPTGLLPWRRSRLERLRVALRDGARTTAYVASFDRSAFGARVVQLEQPAPLARWCRENAVRHAIVGGFFVRPHDTPLGELWIDGAARPTVPFDAPWGAQRACVHVEAGSLTIARRDTLPLTPGGDLLQAGPLLVADGRSAIAPGEDREGFSAGAHQFDSDITDGRYPRAALAIAGERLLAVACDGRTDRDAGLTLSEFAELLIGLGASDALNLDGGGSASLVLDGRLRNRPREQHGVDLLEGRPVATALVFEAL
jgi:Phosphodiester glycosidase